MQIKITMNYHLKPVRMTVIKKNTSDKCWQGGGGDKKELLCTVGMCIGAAIVEISMEFPQKTKNRTTIEPSNSIPKQIPPPQNENTNLKRYMQPSYS